MKKQEKKEIKENSKEPKEEETYDSSEEEEITFTKKGYIEMKKKKNWKAVYCVLFGGTFYYYRSVNETSEPKGKIDLEGTTVASPAKNEKKKNSFTIQRGEELLFVGSCSGAGETEQWVKAIQDSLDKEKTEAPDVGGKKKTKKNWRHLFIGSTFFATKGIKSLINDDTRALLAALKRVVKAESNSIKKADDLEKNILSITLKSYLLLESGNIKAEDLLEADKALREAFELLVRIYNGKDRVKPEKITAALKKVEAIFKQTEQLLEQVLSPHLTAKHMLRVSAIFSTIGEVKFLETVLNDTTLRPDLDKLVACMESYTLNEGNIN